MINKALYPHSLSTFREVMDNNVVGDFNVIRLVAKEMIANSRGKDGERGIIFNTSRYLSESNTSIAYRQRTDRERRWHIPAPWPPSRE